MDPRIRGDGVADEQRKSFNGRILVDFAVCRSGR